IKKICYKIVTDIFKSTIATVNDTPMSYVVHFASPDFCKDPTKNWKDLNRLAPHLTQWDKEVVLGSYLFEAGESKNASYSLCVKYYPTRITFQFNRPRQLHFHYMHLLYTRLMRFRPGGPDL